VRGPGRIAQCVREDMLVAGGVNRSPPLLPKARGFLPSIHNYTVKHPSGYFRVLVT
jgi:hypothetical protein